MRDDKVTIAKGIAIILMVLGHAIAYCGDVESCSVASLYGWTYDFIYMFHMPVFFFLAGYCFKEKYLNDPKTFVIKRINGLYKPFVKWGLLFLLLHNLFCNLNIYNEEYGIPGASSAMYTWSDFALHAFHIVTRMSDAEHMLGGYWFLASLFWASLIGYAGIKFVKPHYTIVGGGIFTLALVYTNKHIPYFGVGAKEFLAALFFVVGHYYNKAQCLLHEDRRFLAVAFITVTAGTIWWPTEMGDVVIWNIVPYFISAICGIVAVLSISEIIAKGNNCGKSFLLYTGNNTMTILTWHLLSFKLVSLAIILIYDIPIAQLAAFPTIAKYSVCGWFLAYTAVGTLLPLAMSRVKFLK